MLADPALKSRFEQASTWLLEDGAVMSAALEVLLMALEADDKSALVIDLVEHGLDQPSQEALMAYLRRRQSITKTLFLLTRSTAILDLDAVNHDETIILCPANHSPPLQVLPFWGPQAMRLSRLVWRHLTRGHGQKGDVPLCVEIV